MRLQLESTTDTINLDDLLHRSTGIQALSGVGGLGLPDVSVHWLEGAGDGAIYRGRRILPRDIDLPLLIQATDRTSLKALLSRLALMLAGACTLRLVDSDGTDWSTTVYRIGGGTYIYGQDTTGETECTLVLTLRAPDPCFTGSRTSSQRVSNAGAGRGLLRGLARLQVSSSQAIGTILLENTGDAPAYPVWDVLGPGRDFRAISAAGQAFHWAGTLTAGQTLRVDTQHATVTDSTGTNRYAELAPAPRLWTIPPGTTLAVASLEDVDHTSAITCSWRPRTWMVI